jgi:hypothetical protein
MYAAGRRRYSKAQQGNRHATASMGLTMVCAVGSPNTGTDINIGRITDR